MTNRLNIAAKLLISGATAISFMFSSTNIVRAVPLARALFAYTPIVSNTAAPHGWVDFCRRYPADCQSQPNQFRKIGVSSEHWNLLMTVNNWVNTRVKPKTDWEHWNKEERWDYAEDGFGDCEDYVLLKRRILMELGMPREALLITVVFDRQHAGHAVLTAHTNEGDFVLDNQTSAIRPWWQTGYQFVMRQAQSDPNAWVSLEGRPSQLPAAVASPDRNEKSRLRAPDLAANKKLPAVVQDELSDNRQRNSKHAKIDAEEERFGYELLSDGANDF